MNYLQRLKIQSCLRNGFLNLVDFGKRSSILYVYAIGWYPFAQNPRFCSTKAGKMNKKQISEAQEVLIDYLHTTSNLQYLDAEKIGRNSPHFLMSLAKRVEGQGDLRKSLRRLLRYNPINEFEPFFESLGLEPSEYSSFLPRDLIHLKDGGALLENCQVLCSYGVTSNKVGKIYKEAPDALRYEKRVLLSRLKSLEKMGFNEASVARLVASSPCFLAEDPKPEFFMVLEELKNVGIGRDWFAEQISEDGSYCWSSTLKFFCFFGYLGFSKEQLGELLRKHPDFLLEDMGSSSVSLVGLLMKFGASMDDVISMFLQFPQIEIKKFILNLRNCYHFLLEIEMETQDIGGLVHAHPILLGSCSLRKVSSIMVYVNCGRKRLCELIRENPQILKNWSYGSKTNRVLNQKPPSPIVEKTKFLMDLGYVENSREMEKALKLFRGKAEELQERFDCLVNAGLSRQDVLKMLERSPQIINQTKEVIQTKLDFLVNSLGYPMSYLITFPAYLSLKIQKVKLRIEMSNWLKGQGIMKDNLALSTIVACSDNTFIRDYVSRHPEGLEVWEKLKKKIYSN